MRIVHISDLHYGRHKPHLLDSLEQRVKAIRPDLILATGDFADEPETTWLTAARVYVQKLATHCANQSQDVDRPNLIVLPGNHDVGRFGLIPRLEPFQKYPRVFGRIPTRAYFKSEGVWIYGFNSARDMGIGANGRVLERDLNAFDAAMATARSEHGKDFDRAFKIVALHHHPLPINRNDEYSRWAMLLNAGDFLEHMLRHDIDLVVHGHEHVHAKAAFEKRTSQLDLNGMQRPDRKKLIVVSVASALHRQPGPDLNRFNVINIDRDQVTVESYQAVNAYDPLPVDRVVIRSREEIAEKMFFELVADKGYKYARVVAQAEINDDGDCRRTTEFSGLDISDSENERARKHRIALPSTSGYIDLFEAHESDGQRAGNALKFEAIAATEPDSREGAGYDIEYGRLLRPGVSFDLKILWWAVNAMAMSRRQYELKYEGNAYREYTHFPVVDPIDELICILQFPLDYPTNYLPRPYAAKLVTAAGQVHGERDSALEQRLREVVFYENPRKAVMRVVRPLIGYSYGFIWTLPEDDDDDGDESGEAEELVDRLLAFRQAKPPAAKDLLQTFLTSLAEFIRAELAKGFAGDLSVDLMVFDRNCRAMVVPAGLRYNDGTLAWAEIPARFEYGEGLAGKAFKARETRLYFRTYGKRRQTPDYYRNAVGIKDVAVLLSMPIYVPGNTNDVYAILNCSSLRKDCPLRKLGGIGAPVDNARVEALQTSISQVCYNELTKIFL